MPHLGKTRVLKDWTGRHRLDIQLFSQGQLSNQQQIRTLDTGSTVLELVIISLSTRALYTVSGRQVEA